MENSEFFSIASLSCDPVINDQKVIKTRLHRTHVLLIVIIEHISSITCTKDISNILSLPFESLCCPLPDTGHGTIVHSHHTEPVEVKEIMYLYICTLDYHSVALILKC